MNHDEKKVSDYIDRLNEEKRPREHGSESETPEMEQLFETVRRVRGLKEPSLPQNDYPKKLAFALSKQLSKEKDSKKSRRSWFLSAASIAAVLAIVFILNMASPLGRRNMVYAMEKAFQEVKAYHGFLEIVETNADGKSTLQAVVEVWADKEGHYYVKGLEGPNKDLITVNDGQKKWQIQPEQRQVNIFPAFPDPYHFTFDIGKEIDDVKNALQTEVIDDDMVAGRPAVVMEVTPQGGSPYKIWIDKETKMPLQKQSAMEYGLQYNVSYIKIDFSEAIPKELLAYRVPSGFEEISINPEQLVSNLEEAQGMVGFAPKVPQNIPTDYILDYMAVGTDMKAAKMNYTSQDNKKKVVVLQRKAAGEFKPASMATIGKVDDNIAEIQAPIQDGTGILGGGPYAGATGINAIRWQQEGIEYAVVGNTSLEELALFIKGLTNGTVEFPKEQSLDKPQVEVPVDVEAEEGDQKNADAGHSPWKLDPAFVAQVFVSLKMSPQGIQGEYPIKMEDLKVIHNNGKEAVVEVKGSKIPIKRVYLKRLIRQDATGIWTVVGYDPVE
ncbi:MAG: LolA family protein [Bacillota bacterium]